jgi:tellurite resistance protein TerC
MVEWWAWPAVVVFRFAYLKLGLAVVLVFVGAKMLVSDVYEVPIWVSLAVITALIGSSVVASMRSTGGWAPQHEGIAARSSD